ncbi:UNVERIFIED_CONTAM: hypothetical protein PYX00_002198 [Menopon gallinae]|uniref:Invertebrate defensins family profile domain-containing protein n=1 Tax=Menopon gallinae TaxID=328185 RepID=A0AAW2IGC8_9NEOP
MVRIAFVILAVAVFAFAHPAEEQRLTETEYRKDFEVTVEEEKVVEESLVHPTVKCEHIHPGNGEASHQKNDRACESHCRTLGEEYVGGNCTEGMCNCRRKQAAQKTTSHPTVKCVDLIPQEGKPSAENHEGCNAHCKTLKNGYKKGQCEKEICHCKV